MPADRNTKASPTRPRRLGDVAQWDIETDVAIIGFGGAGACAAIEAHDKGADAIIFELSSASGGSTAMSSAEIYMGGSGGTRVQQACGFQDSVEEMVKHVRLAGGRQVDEEKVRLYCERSVEHFATVETPVRHHRLARGLHHHGALVDGHRAPGRRWPGP